MTSQAPVYCVVPARGRFSDGSTYLQYHDGVLIPSELDDPALHLSAFYSDELNDLTDRVCLEFRNLWRST